MHEFWARNKFVQAKFVLVKLCTSTFSKLRASEILSTCYPRNGVYLKIRASEICTSEIRASQGTHVAFTIPFGFTETDYQFNVHTINILPSTHSWAEIPRGSTLKDGQYRPLLTRLYYSKKPDKLTVLP